jgi:hypothetical protein
LTQQQLAARRSGLFDIGTDPCDHLGIAFKLGERVVERLGNALDVDMPQGQARCEAGVLSLAPDRQRELIIGYDDRGGFGVLALRLRNRVHRQDLGRAEGLGDEDRGIGVPLDDIDLLILELIDNELDARSALANTGPHRVNPGLQRGDRDLRARARLTGDRLDLNLALLNLGHLDLEQAPEHVLVGAAQQNLRPAQAALDLGHVRAHTLLRLVLLARNPLLAQQNALGPAKVDHQRGWGDAGDDAIDDLAFPLGKLAELKITLGLAQLLHDHLLGILGGNPAKVLGRHIDEDDIADFRLGLVFARLGQGDFRPVIHDAVDDFFLDENAHVARVNVHLGSHILAVHDVGVLAVRLNEC